MHNKVYVNISSSFWGGKQHRWKFVKHEHELDSLKLDIETIFRQGYDNGANVKGYTSGVQLLQKSSGTLFTSHGHTTTTS